MILGMWYIISSKSICCILEDNRYTDISITLPSVNIIYRRDQRAPPQRIYLLSEVTVHTNP